MIKREEFTFDSRDHLSKIYAFRWIPETDKPVCIVQIVHGMAEYIERYDEFARFLASHGMIVIGEDHLGHGRTADVNKMPHGYFCKNDPATVVVRDVHRLKKLTQEKYPGIPIIIIGHSMGSFILRNYLMRYGKGIDGAVIMGTGNQPNSMLRSGKLLCSFLTLFQGGKHKSLLLNGIAFGPYEAGIKDKRTPFDWVCTDTAVIDSYIEDPKCGFTFTLNGFRTLFELISRINKNADLEKIPKKLPILIVSGKEDPVGNYGKDPSDLYDHYLNLDLTKVQLKLYPEVRHELLNEPIKEQVYKDLLNWIKAVI